MGDVADPDQAAALVAAAGEGLGGLDILVNNASVRAKCDLEEMSWEEWRRIVGVTLDGAFLCAKAALPLPEALSRRAHRQYSAAAQGTRVRRITSTSWLRNRGCSGVTKALAHDLGAFGITVNMVSPGLIRGTRSTFPSAPPSAGRSKPARSPAAWRPPGATAGRRRSRRPRPCAIRRLRLRHRADPSRPTAEASCHEPRHEPRIGSWNGPKPLDSGYRGDRRPQMARRPLERLCRAKGAEKDAGFIFTKARKRGKREYESSSANEPNES